MFKNLLKKVLGSQHEREVKKLGPMVDEINQVYEGLSSLSEEELKGKTEEFRERIRSRTRELEEKIEELREEKRHSEDASHREALTQRIASMEEELLEAVEEVLDEILPEAYAVVKETCRRNLGREIVVTGQKMTWDMVPYDVQLIGAMALHQGKAAEMATGEGKTLAATMPLYLNALAGRGAHLVTVNSYLAQRDAEWMGVIYEYLGLTVDVIDLYEPGSTERREAYNADITYGTNNEFGFDYLRDNMVHTLEQRVQRGHHYVIIDEVDSILIDEARTPLIISGPVGKDTSTPFKQYANLVSSLYKKQLRLANQLVKEAEELLEEEEGEYAAGEKLLAVKRGTPKHRKLLKMFADEPKLQRLVQRVEGDYMREKILYQIDEQLFFAMDEKGHNVSLSDKGIEELSPQDPDAFVIPDLSEAMGAIEEDESLSVEEKRNAIQELEASYAAKSQKMHVIHQLLKAYTLFHKDEQYIIGEDGSVVIVDEFTGRQMAGRRWSDGLHQAVEAKEGVEIRGETQTLATITIQNYFRMYEKLAGMTGTAETEENEFHQIYDLDVLVIPTNEPVIRDDRDDLIFRTKREKYVALMDEIDRLSAMDLPVLVGTTNVEVSETLSRMLKRRGIRHNVLNAKHHKKESEIVAEAGQPGTVTIATNMAGRGTDIKLGEGVTDTRTVAWARERELNPEELLPVDPNRYLEPEKLTDDHVLEVGGLHILGSERHESRRIDRQLRGRAGRQGDPGATQFFLSLEDDLMRLFMNERVAGAMEKWGVQEGEVITHGLVTKSIGQAQKRVEGNNFEARKKLLDYDDVMNQQREVVYDLRLFALEGGEDLKGEIWEMVENSIRGMVDEYCVEGVPAEEWDLPGLRKRLLLDFFVMANELPEEPTGPDDEAPFDDPDDVAEVALEAAREHFHRKITDFAEHGERVMSWIMLSTIDDKWKDHLYDLDHLKASIGFRGWGQKDPLIEYKKDAYEMFVDLMTDIRRTITSLFFRAQVGVAPERRRAPAVQALDYSGPTDTPRDRFGAAAAAQQGGPAPGGGGGAGQRAAAAAAGGGGGGAIDEMGVARSAQADTGAGAPAGGGGPDPRQLLTNRGEERKQTPVTVDQEPGRNDPCPCGSGKKYKKCCGRPT
jgi:preprotein translocase subunit SecA